MVHPHRRFYLLFLSGALSEDCRENIRLTHCTSLFTPATTNYTFIILIGTWSPVTSHNCNIAPLSTYEHRSKTTRFRLSSSVALTNSLVEQQQQKKESDEFFKQKCQTSPVSSILIGRICCSSLSYVTNLPFWGFLDCSPSQNTQITAYQKS